MNERMYDLAIEVLKDYPTLESWTFTREELEKFTEMVVRDCVAVLDAQQIEDRNEDWMDATWNSCINHIKHKISNHFGVDDDPSV